MLPLFGNPVQEPISDERILEMLRRTPRRMQLCSEWPQPLHEPDSAGKDWCLTLPFKETLGNAFECMCQVETIGLRETKQRCWTFLRHTSSDDAPVDVVRQWLSTVGRYLAIRDCLALSFALNYDREGGDPKKRQTDVGALRSCAKPYDNAPTNDTYAAAGQLAQKLLAFATELPCYRAVDAIVAMPPADPAKPFDLPSHLAAIVAQGLGKPNLTGSATTIRKRASLKATALNAKLPTIQGTIAIDERALRGKSILLIDDLYQSGISLNYVAKVLLEAGATAILGLACEKTCRNDDNVQGAQ